MERWGANPRIVPDFGQGRRQRRGSGRSRSWLGALLPVAAGLGLIGLLESAHVMRLEMGAKPLVPGRHAVAICEPADWPPEAFQAFPVSRCP